MFNEMLGVISHESPSNFITSYSTAAGCLVHGPYLWMKPGRYQVNFKLGLLEPAEQTSIDPVASIDITTAFGTIILADRLIYRHDLLGDDETFAIQLDLLDQRQLEFRVHVFGQCSVVAYLPCWKQIAAEEGTPPIDVRVTYNDPFMLAHQVRAVMRLLEPKAASGVSKIRLGNVGDGGYVCLNDFTGVDTAFSLGINDDISWDLDAADHGLKIYQFDHTVDDPAPNDDRFVFTKKMIAPDQGFDRETISDLVKLHDKGAVLPNLLLKMDIENAEWSAILATDARSLSRFSQIVCELHYFQGLTDVCHRTAVFDALTAIKQHYEVVHVHANNYAAWANIENVIIPCVLEVSFANRAIFSFENNGSVFPTVLDASCDPTKPDMFLGAFRF